jgi:hypothetical protein
MPKMLKNNQL